MDVTMHTDDDGDLIAHEEWFQAGDDETRPASAVVIPDDRIVDLHSWHLMTMSTNNPMDVCPNTWYALGWNWHPLTEDSDDWPLFVASAESRKRLREIYTTLDDSAQMGGGGDFSTFERANSSYTSFPRAVFWTLYDYLEPSVRSVVLKHRLRSQGQ